MTRGRYLLPLVCALLLLSHVCATEESSGREKELKTQAKQQVNVHELQMLFSLNNHPVYWPLKKKYNPNPSDKEAKRVPFVEGAVVSVMGDQIQLRKYVAGHFKENRDNIKESKKLAPTVAQVYIDVEEYEGIPRVIVAFRGANTENSALMMFKKVWVDNTKAMYTRTKQTPFGSVRAPTDPVSSDDIGSDDGVTEKMPRFKKFKQAMSNPFKHTVVKRVEVDDENPPRVTEGSLRYYELLVNRHLIEGVQAAVDVLRKRTENFRVIFTGFSMGGPMAQLAAVDMARRFESSFGNKIEVMVYGSPKLGNQAFVDAAAQYVSSGRYLRIVAEHDPVPTIPKEKTFRSAGTLMRVKTGGECAFYGTCWDGYGDVPDEAEVPSFLGLLNGFRAYHREPFYVERFKDWADKVGATSTVDVTRPVGVVEGCPQYETRVREGGVTAGGVSEGSSEGSSASLEAGPDETLEDRVGGGMDSDTSDSELGASVVDASDVESPLLTRSVRGATRASRDDEPSSIGEPRE